MRNNEEYSQITKNTFIFFYWFAIRVKSKCSFSLSSSFQMVVGFSKRFLNYLETISNKNRSTHSGKCCQRFVLSRRSRQVFCCGAGHTCCFCRLSIMVCFKTSWDPLANVKLPSSLKEEKIPKKTSVLTGWDLPALQMCIFGLGVTFFFFL